MICTNVLWKGFKMIRFIVLVAFLSFSASFTHAEGPSDQLIAALIQHESRGDDHAVGDKNLRHKAYGCLQIRQLAVDDYNRWNGTNHKAEDCLGNRVLSIAICRSYIGHYATESRLGRRPTDEDNARIWNGGPVGCFDNGSLDKFGRKPKTEKTRKDVARLQLNAAGYWQRKIEPLLKKS